MAYLTSRLNKEVENRKSFNKFLKNTFDIHNKKSLDEKQEISITHSSAYRNYAKTDKQIKRLQTAKNDRIAQGKITEFIDIRKELIPIFNDRSSSVKGDIDNKVYTVINKKLGSDKLKENRSLFFKPVETLSIISVKKMVYICRVPNRNY